MRSCPAHQIDDLQMNDIQFMFCDQVIVFDHFKQQIKVIANVHVQPFATDADIARAYQATCEKIDATIEKIKRPLGTETMTHNPIVMEPDLVTFALMSRRKSILPT